MILQSAGQNLSQGKIMKIVNKIIETVILGIGKIHWGTNKFVSTHSQDEVRKLLVPNYYIVLTHRSNHLSSFFVGLANFALTGKWGYWTHALMNAEDEAKSDSDFRLIEAVGTGVKYTPFDQVFDVQGLVLLKPKTMPLDRWTNIIDRAAKQIGKPYDSLFDLKSDSALSCVELVRYALMAEPDYMEHFAHFESLINRRKNLSPQMFYECEDFEIVFEARV